MNVKRDMSKWKKISGHAGRKIIYPGTLTPASAIQVVEYRIPLPSSIEPPEGDTIFFFSDLHWKDASHAKLKDFPAALQAVSPDWIVFGGDLITYACHFRDAFDWLRETFSEFPDTPKLAVPGNWDRRRKKWFPTRVWEEEYGRAGFHFPVNSSVTAGEILFHGVDDIKAGHPVANPNDAATDRLNIWVAHSPDALADNLTDPPPPGVNLALCGHTHGGQIRIPFFGALDTSSKYWKKFEYGHRALGGASFDMIVSSGLGESRLPLRFLCPPEVVVVKLETKDTD